jgi:hypothetical protein
LTTAAQARQFGVKYVLERSGAIGPTGATFDRHIGNEDLYRIPDSADATLVPSEPGRSSPPADAAGTPVTVTHPSPSSLRITTDSQTSQILRLRLTDEPGWHATIDGRPINFVPFARVMLQARIPAGHHVIELHYWPTLFTVGLVMAACALLLLLLVVLASARGYHLSARTIECKNTSNTAMSKTRSGGASISQSVRLCCVNNQQDPESYDERVFLCCS